MSEQKTWMDDLLEQVAAGRMLPQDALNRFFLHKREDAQGTLTEADHAFLTAMDAAETAAAIGCRCFLIEGGHQERSVLDTAQNAMVVDSIGAVLTALGL